MTAWNYAEIAIGAFLLVSIPFGLVISSIFYRTDIRKSGSGNIGAMNALRTLGKGGAIAVLLLDVAKGVVLPLVVMLELHDTHLAALAAACAVLGHCFSPWLGFKGGKGVATSFGAIFALSWPAGIASRTRSTPASASSSAPTAASRCVKATPWSSCTTATRRRWGWPCRVHARKIDA